MDKVNAWTIIAGVVITYAVCALLLAQGKTHEIMNFEEEYVRDWPPYVRVRPSTLVYESQPFPHVIVNDFLTDSGVLTAYSEASRLRLEDAHTRYVNPSSPVEYNKFGFSQVDKMSPVLRSIFEELTSVEFTRELEELTGIRGLIAEDMSLRGAGVHVITNGGRLQMHTDFNSYIHPVHGWLDRRLNLLLYLNPMWKSEYHGDLLLADPDVPGRIKRVAPTINKCVIFSTTGRSPHGHPEPLTAPPGVRRQSIAVYYYTRNLGGGVDFEGVAPHSTLWNDHLIP